MMAQNRDQPKAPGGVVVPFRRPTRPVPAAKKQNIGKSAVVVVLHKTADNESNQG